MGKPADSVEINVSVRVTDSMRQAMSRYIRRDATDSDVVILCNALLVAELERLAIEQGIALCA